MKIRKHDRGVTLVELSTTLAITVATLTLGVPAFQTLQTDRQRNQVCSDLSASFALARAEAIRHGFDVSLCPSVDGFTCINPPDGDWSAGWIVTTSNAGTAHVIESMHPRQTPAFSISADTALAAGVTFSSAGLPSTTGSFTYSDGIRFLQFRLMPIGRLEVAP